MVSKRNHTNFNIQFFNSTVSVCGGIINTLEIGHHQASPADNVNFLAASTNLRDCGT